MNVLQEACAELIDRATDTINGFDDYRRAHGITWQAIETQCGAMSVLSVQFFPGARFDFSDEPDAHPAQRAVSLPCPGTAAASPSPINPKSMAGLNAIYAAGIAARTLRT